MDKYLFARIFIDSPKELDPGYDFIESLQECLSDICHVDLISIERYTKITEYLKIEVNILLDRENVNKLNVLSFFVAVIESLGEGWSLMGTDKEPEAIWNNEEDCHFFREEVRWANITTVDNSISEP